MKVFKTKFKRFNLAMEIKNFEMLYLKVVMKLNYF